MSTIRVTHRRTVTEAQHWYGPRGGSNWLLTLNCGHRVERFNYAKPPKRVRCQVCWKEWLTSPWKGSE